MKPPPTPVTGPGPDPDVVLAGVDARLAAHDTELAELFPGPPTGRQPVHTLYLPADRVHARIVSDVGAVALAAFDEHLPDPAALQRVFRAAQVSGDSGGGDLVAPADAPAIHALVRAKLEVEPVEDLRIDFEDGFTQRDVPARRRDSDEDGHVDRVLAEVITRWSGRSSSPPFWGVRFGSLDPATRRRGVLTFTRVVAGLAAAPDRDALLAGFRPTLPKVTSVDQVRAMVGICRDLEAACDLPERALRFEIQIETPQSICAPDGSALVARLIHAADGRCIGLHYGTYDYSAACGIAAEYQAMDHPAADHAKAVMQVAAAGTGVALSDGSTNRLPVGDAEAVHEAWRLHARLIDRSLRRGFYQGWDLHPAQLVSRYAATYAFYRRSLPAACERIAAYLGTGPNTGYLDEPATTRALAAFCQRALDCGAVTADEITSRAGVDRADLAALTHPRTDHEESR
ncbi:Citrate lyase beta subunit [Dietzia kunjamensis subsp. schimae]|uniref:Citrate lyase beta subunit n=1 Tax=Dietzia kunjamensis subsp. schimae TaxID=498198 RepID=A0ABY1N0V3_9ACTN|nr:aldolase [Dietzia kunjamensis]SMO66467.1 Citrate lyase beta subunit [Dietzia kunjamensis subsp. schimae]